MSSAALVAWLKMSLPAPTSFRTSRNVSSMFAPAWTASSSAPDSCISCSDSSSISVAVTPAAPPVDFRTAAVWADTFWACDISPNASRISSPAPASPTNPAPSPVNALVRLRVTRTVADIRVGHVLVELVGASVGLGERPLERAAIADDADYKVIGHRDPTSSRAGRASVRSRLRSGVRAGPAPGWLPGRRAGCRGWAGGAGRSRGF